MGAKLIFKNADFSRNAINDDVTDITSDVEWSAACWQYINASNMDHAYQNRSGVTTLKIGRINVSQYVGRKIKLTISCPTGWTASNLASNVAFASAMNPLPSSSTGSNVQNAITSVEDIIVPSSETVSGPKTLELEVPQGAVWLVFKNSFTTCPYPSVGLVGEES